jgi:hypothetical protein
LGWRGVYIEHIWGKLDRWGKLDGWGTWKGWSALDRGGKLDGWSALDGKGGGGKIGCMGCFR